MVEREPSMVRTGATDRRKRSDHTSRELKDVSALCDEKVARGESGGRGLNWSDSHVSFHGATGTRDRRHRRGNPLAVDQTEILAALLGRVHRTRDSGHAVGPCKHGKGSWMGHSGCVGRSYGLGDSGKFTWIGGVKHSCER